MYREAKVAQMAAYFLMKRGGQMSHLKLMKLLYLADRESVRRYGRSLSDDHAVSMPHGPVLSMTLDYMDGHMQSGDGGWDAWISPKENHEVSLVQPGGHVDLLDELSPADVDVLQKVWEQFGHMDRWEIRDWTHQHCTEWQDPNGSVLPIPHDALCRAVGHANDVARDYLRDMESDEAVDKLFAGR